MKKSLKSPLKIGKKDYGNMKKEDAFKKALEPYFNKKLNGLIVS